MGQSVVLALFLARLEPVLDTADFENAKLVECPARDAVREKAICADGFAARARLDLCWRRYPIVAEHVECANNRQAGRVAGLKGGDERQLGAGCEQFFDGRLLFCRVVRVCRLRRAEDGCQERVRVTQ